MAEVRIPFFRPSITEEDIHAVESCLRSGWLTSGPNVAAFERELADYVGARYVNVVNSCTAAMHLALRAWGIGPGDEVITTPYTFASTVTVILHAGAEPVLADIRDHDGNIDPAEVERTLSSRTKAILPVHFAGEPCDLDALLAIARPRGLKVLEDAAHALGAKYRGRMVGTIGDATAFSFYATKNITTGEGGALATDDETLSERVRVLTLHGMTKDAWNRYDAGGSWWYDIQEFGFKDNLPDPAAALGRSQLRRAEALRARRERAARRYLEQLRDDPYLILPGFDPRNRHAWHLFVVRIRDGAPRSRDEVVQALAAQGIGTSVHFIPVHYHSAFRRLGRWREGDFPVAEAFFRGAISLPLYPDMTDAEVDTVCEALRDAVRGKAVPAV